jgi:hypothetical protein
MMPLRRLLGFSVTVTVSGCLSRSLCTAASDSSDRWPIVCRVSEMPTLYPTLLEEMESFMGLQGNFSEAELPKMP